jgi:Protein of unknown function (DUF3309)
MSEIANKSVEQKDAEAEVESFREDLGPFVVAAETTRMAMVFTDAKEADNPIIFVNDSFLSFGAPGLPLIHVNPASSRTRDKNIADASNSFPSFGSLRRRSQSAIATDPSKGDSDMSLWTIVVIILVIALLGGFSGIGGGPFYGTGYYGGGGLGLVIVVLVILLLLGKL